MAEILPATQRGALIVQELKKSESEFANMLPTFLRAQKDRLFGFALSAIKTPALAQCQAMSVVQAVLTSARLGIPCDGIHGALVPYKQDCTFIPMYRGLMMSVRRSGEIRQFSAECHYEGETCKVTYGTHRKLTHTPKMDAPRLPENILGAYATARWKDGTIDFEYMDIEEIRRIMQRSRAQNGPWKTDFAEMAKKTAMRRLCKKLPLTVELQQFIDEEEKRELGIEDDPAPAEFEVVTPKSLDDLVPPQNGDGEIPPERWHAGVAINLVQPARLWLDQAIAGKGPLNGKTYRQAAESQDPAIVAEINRILGEGAKLQADNGTTAEPYQKLAEARRVIALKSAPADQEQTQETFA